MKYSPKTKSTRCQPGIFCVEYYTMFFLAICLSVIIYMGVTQFVYDADANKKVIINNTNTSSQSDQDVNGYGGYGGYGYGGGYGNGYGIGYDVLRNPYVPPLNMASAFFNNRLPFRAPFSPPITIATSSVPISFTQVGMLAPVNGSTGIISLMGRPLSTNRNKWQYYTMSDQYNSVKLPVYSNGRSGMDEYGCDEIYSGSTVQTVSASGAPYTVSMYDNATVSYVPY